MQPFDVDMCQNHEIDFARSLQAADIIEVLFVKVHVFVLLLARERGALEGQNDMCSAARCKNTSLFASMS